MLPLAFHRVTICRTALGKSCRVFWVGALTSLLCISGALADPAAPRDVVAAFQDTLLATMKEGRSLGFEGRYQKLLPTMDKAFDFKQMTRLVVGSRWANMSEAEQKELDVLFRRFSVSNHASQFADYRGEKFEIMGVRPRGEFGSVVETRLILKDEAPVQLNYLLRPNLGRWEIVDVYLGGTISELARRRDEFSSVIRAHGVDGLIALLKKKNEELAGS